MKPVSNSIQNLLTCVEFPQFQPTCVYWIFSTKYLPYHHARRHTTRREVDDRREVIHPVLPDVRLPGGLDELRAPTQALADRPGRDVPRICAAVRRELRCADVVDAREDELRRRVRSSSHVALRMQSGGRS